MNNFHNVDKNVQYNFQDETGDKKQKQGPQPDSATHPLRRTQTKSYTFHKTKKSTTIKCFITLSFDYLRISESNEIIASSCSIYQNEQIHGNYFCQSFHGKSIKERSESMLQSVIKDLVVICQKTKTKFVYFDSHKKISAILLLRALALCQEGLQITMRDGIFYEVRITKPIGRKGRQTTIMILRDYYHLLNAPLEKFSQDIGRGKTKIPSIDSLNECSLEQDFYKELSPLKRAQALYNILKETQKIVFEKFSCDITQSKTISGLAMRIFTTHFLKDTIYTNGETNDTFLRKAYFGGHVDIYKPIADNVYVYDINSLYPYSMLFDMPYGEPNWILYSKNLKLEKLFGFIEAKITCPKNINRPFLPLRHNNRVYYPTGTWTGVYFSEELKFAKTLGYTIEVKNILLFKKRKSPLLDFVNTLYNMRLKAKEEKKAASLYIYKQILVSLYGRMGLRPDFTTSVVGTSKDLRFYYKNYVVEGNIKLANDRYLIMYKPGSPQPIKTRTDLEDNEEATRCHQEEKRRIARLRFSNTAVHIAAAITSYARIHMYPYIRDENVLYTDTDSIITTVPLPDTEISPTILGKFKCEAENAHYIGLAPKLYVLRYANGQEKIVKSGLGKSSLTYEKAMSIYHDPNPSDMISKIYVRDDIVKSTIEKLYSYQQSFNVLLRQPKIIGRELIYHKKTGMWTGTKPIHIELEDQ